MAFLSLAAVGMTRAAAGYRTALALVIPTLAREKPFWTRKRYENNILVMGKVHSWWPKKI